MGTDQRARKRFTLILIKPSHYDDDGYVIQWLRSAIPSNTLAVMNGLALDCKERRVLGDDVDIDIKAYDETNTRIRPDRIARQLADGAWTGRAGRRAVESVSAGHGYCAAAARGWRSGLHGRLSCFGMSVDAAGASTPELQGGDGPGHFAVRGRGRRAFRAGSARRLERDS